MILTIDSGTSATKVAVWDRTGLVAIAAVSIEARHPAPGWTEQDAAAWWAAVPRACAELRRTAPGALASVEAIGCAGARQTLALVDATGEPTGPAIVWSDRRAGREAAAIAGRLRVGSGTDPQTGIVLDAASVAAKLAWLATHRQEGLERATWVMTPRDLVVWHLTGIAATDSTTASRSGLYDAGGSLVGALAGPASAKLPPVVGPDEIVGPLQPAAAAAASLPVGIPVVIGAGDRASEVLGTGASEERPMVSWGTTANVSMPVPGPPVPPRGIVASRAVGGSWLLEGGLSAAGSLLEWLSRLVGRSAEDLAADAYESPPGARGVVATPWLEGARSPWWRPGAGAAFVGMGPEHGPADVARALFESVAWDVVRCLDAMAVRRAGPPVEGLALAGSGAGSPVWRDVLAGVAGVPLVRRRSGQSSSAGAARLAAGAVGLDWDLDVMDPIEGRTEPAPDAVEQYRRLRARVDAVAAAVLELPGAPAGGSPCG